MRVLARRAYSLALVRMRRFEIQNERSALLLDEVVADVSSQLDAQAQLGVQIRRVDEVPEVGPTNGGLWYQVPAVTAVFADLKGSTDLNANDGPQAAAYAYTYFIRAMAVIMDRFSAGYVDIQGDGIFGLFSGPASEFQAMACAITWIIAHRKASEQASVPPLRSLPPGQHFSASKIRTRHFSTPPKTGRLRENQFTRETGIDGFD